MKPNRKIIGRKKIINGSYLKYLPYAVKNLITAIRLVENKKGMDAKEYVELYEHSAHTTFRIWKTTGIECPNQIVMMNYWI